MSRTSYVLAEEPSTDLEIAEALVEELEDYIVDDELYRTVIVRTPTGDHDVRMTGGDLLSRFKRLQGERDKLSAEEQRRLDAALKQAESVIYSLRTRFHERLQREMKARLSSLRWFLDDCAGDRNRCRTEFPFEMRNRQRIEEILTRIGSDLPDELREELDKVDSRIRQLTHGTTFIWDERLRDVFPQYPYWYLYVLP